jgi:23S rRNA (uridine2552-2'-O)-methyltransferase
MVRAPTGGTEEGRGKPARLKTAKMRTPSSQAWLSRQINDPWSAKARAHGYRSRAAYKLTDIADRFGLLKPGQRVIDLGAAPGGWTQVAIERGVTYTVIPWQMGIVAKALRLLPNWLYDRIFTNAPRKPRGLPI